MVSKGTKKDYVQFLGAASTGVTQSCHLVRIGKYAILLDCGIYQESDIRTNYKVNQELLKKIHVKDIDWIILHEAHSDHTANVPSLYAKGCNAHIIVPTGTTAFLKELWTDSAKIMAQDAMKLQKKHGLKATAFYDEEDIVRALNRCIEVDIETPYRLVDGITLTYYPSNHIINACQISLEITHGYQKKVLGFTGDIGSKIEQNYVLPRKTLPFSNLLISENTYNVPGRPNKKYDRDKDRNKIATAINQYNLTLFPVFALGRCQTIVTEIYKLWKDGKIPYDQKVYIDSPLAKKFCMLYPDDDPLWHKVLNWKNLRFVDEYTESMAMHSSKERMTICGSAGFMTAGRIVGWAKDCLHRTDCCILFSGYASQNSLAYQIRYGEKYIQIDGESVANNANIVELVSFSSHASYEELTEYLTQDCRFDKLVLVHGEQSAKSIYANELEKILHSQGKSARVIATNADTRIYL